MGWAKFWAIFSQTHPVAVHVVVVVVRLSGEESSIQILLESSAKKVESAKNARRAIYGGRACKASFTLMRFQLFSPNAKVSYV
jgi:hypothetical protein